ncbi:Sua5/YciO/YrdC/YwlC family protein [Pseudomonas sp. GM16]|nr:Sua5/YciO/YrdC/YwlC family protein [Pseudomonas sp. GM16]
MNVDLHCHSTASDGALAPAVLVARAFENGVRVLALTDHDTLEGLAEARMAATELGMQLVNGVELSCTWGGATIHVLGYGFDVNAAPLVEAIAKLHDGRWLRSEEISRKLALKGMPGALEGARQVQQELGDSGNAPARPHFADWMVREGFVKDRAEAFRKWLGAGKLGDVKLHWPTLEDTVGTLRAAGAWVSLAHPWHYDFTRSKRRKLIADYIQAGGHAIEGSMAISLRNRWAAWQSLPVSSVCWSAPAVTSMALAAGPRSASTGRFPRTFHPCGVGSNMTQILPPSEQVENVSQFFQIHPENPQARLIKQAVEIIRKGGVVVYPTDSSYAIGCQIGDKTAIERVRRLRQLDEKHNFALICSDLSQLGNYAKIDTGTFRILKAHLPGPYTFILNATREVPRLLLHPKKRTIGLRVPSHPIALALLAELGEPLMSVTLIMPGDEDPLSDPYEMRQLLEHQVDLIIDGGFGGIKASTVIDLTGDDPEVVRVGCGDPTPFMVEA